MRKSECFELGIVAKLHGVQGQVAVEIDSDQPGRYAKLDSVFLELKGELVPFLIDKIQVTGSRALVRFQGVDTVEKAEALKGKKLYLPLAQLPPLKGKNRFYFHEIVDFTVTDVDKGPLGTVRTVYSLPHQNLLAMDYQNQEVLIPLNDDIVLSVDRELKTVLTRLPDGLLDVYLSAEEQHDEG